MTMHKQDEYAFPCAVVRSNENNILSKADMAKVLDAKDIGAVMNILGEFGYGTEKQARANWDFESSLRAEMTRVYELLFSVAPDKKELSLFLLPSDYHNVKVSLKSEFLGINPAPYLVAGGNLSPEEIGELVRERNFPFMSKEMAEAVNEILESFAKSKDPQEIDIMLDRACYSEMERLAGETERPFIIGYVKLLVDLMNITTFIRLREIQKPWAFFQKVFLPGGNMDQHVFTTAYEEGYQQFADRMIPYGYRDIFAKGAVEVHNTGKYTLLEKLCDDKRMSYVSDARYVSFGVEPLIGYMVAKETENKNLRIILSGKMAGTPEDVIKERLRDTYV